MAHQWCDGPVILESDCSSCVVVLAEHVMNHSIYASLVDDIKNIMRMLGNVCLVKINREQTLHELAQYARLGWKFVYNMHVVLLVDCNVT